MSEEFYPTGTQNTVVFEKPALEVSQQSILRRMSLGIAGAGMIIGSLGAGLVAESAEATIWSPGYNPNASFPEKAQNVEVIAHRGLVGYYNGRKADEDTVRSCLHAIAEGATVCEMDIRVPAHGKYTTPKPLVIHDATTNRVSRDCNLTVSRTSYRRLKQCHTNHGDRFSSLSEMAVALSPYRDRVGIIAEIKESDASMRELRTINNIFEKNGFNATNLKYESFFGSKLRAMKTIAPDVGGLLIQGSISSPMRAANLPAAFDGLIIPYQAYVNGIKSDPNYAEEYRARNDEIMAWGVETVDQMTYFTQHGGSGFMTDYTPRAKQLK